MGIKTLGFIITCLIITSCAPMFRILLGVDINADWISSEKELKEEAKRIGIDSRYMYNLDTFGYYQSLVEIYKDTTKFVDSNGMMDSAKLQLHREVVMDDYQLTQFRLFDSSGQEVFKIVNCYLDPPIPMNWNVNGCFDTFPPKIDIAALNIHNFDLDYILTKLETPISITDLPVTKYYGVIFWNSILIKPSRKLIKTIDSKIGLDHEEITFIFINNHNALCWDESSEEEQKRIVDEMKSM